MSLGIMKVEVVQHLKSFAMARRAPRLFFGNIFNNFKSIKTCPERLANPYNWNGPD